MQKIIGEIVEQVYKKVIDDISVELSKVELSLKNKNEAQALIDLEVLKNKVSSVDVNKLNSTTVVVTPTIVTPSVATTVVNPTVVANVASSSNGEVHYCEYVSSTKSKIPNAICVGKDNNKTKATFYHETFHQWRCPAHKTLRGVLDGEGDKKTKPKSTPNKFDMEMVNKKAAMNQAVMTSDILNQLTTTTSQTNIITEDVVDDKPDDF